MTIQTTTRPTVRVLAKVTMYRDMFLFHRKFLKLPQRAAANWHSAMSPSHLVTNLTSQMPYHTQFRSPQMVMARGSFVSSDFAQTGAVHTLECACGLKLKGVHAKGNLARHQRSRGCTAYAEEKRCKCPECPRVFWRSDALLNHRRKKHEAPPCRPNRLRRHLN
jgi:hypothetical protein